MVPASLITVGSLNETKIQAVRSVYPDSFNVIGRDVEVTISEQPMSDQETRQGAIERAEACSGKDSIGIGLEGGIMVIEGTLYLCSWGALAEGSRIVTASGARLALPDSFYASLLEGRELKDVMDSYTERSGVSHKEGAVGVFTNGLISRTSMFSHIVQLLEGQRQYHQ
ncbi:DUF84 family protein [Sinobaca sp. H24]|uniref:DUF84 family protein n=1 Tax=Sinobaca sp. H24 TaxID=2923376 RepID=UPI00207AB255|nr:DUF84 family protein [Sinobaca sp. H24]